MGVVLRAYDTTLNREVAVKVMLGNAAQEGQNNRFLREAELTGKLEHPGIVPVHFRGKDADGHDFFSMKLVTGEELGKILDQWHAGDKVLRREYPLSRLISIFERICETVGFAHSQGVIHRDLKPGNIMVGEHGEIWVLDWGLAKELGNQDAPPAANVTASKEELLKTTRTQRPPANGLTLDGATVGTPQFMSPEQARGETLDFRSDIFALGGLLCYVLNGKTAVRGTSAQECMANLASGRIVPLKKLEKGRHIPPPLTAIASKCLSPQPERRYQTVPALLADLRAWQRDEPISALRDTLWMRLSRWSRHHRLLLTAGGATGVLLLTIVAAGAAYVAHATQDRLAAEESARTAEARRLAAEAEKEKEALARLHAENEAQKALLARAAQAKRRMDAYVPFGKGQDLILRGQKPEEAERHFREALEIDGEFPEAQFGLGDALRRQGLMKAAAEAYLSANASAEKLRSEPWTQALLAAAFAFNGGGYFDDSDKIFVRAAAIEGDEPLTLVGRVYALVRLGRLSEAETTARKAVHLAPHLWETHFSLGYIFREKTALGMLPGADGANLSLQSLNKAWELDPQQAELNCFLAIVLGGSSNPELSKLALKYFDRTVELEPLNGFRHLNRANYYRQIGKTKEFEADFAKAVELRCPEECILVFSAMRMADTAEQAFVNMKKALEKSTAHANTIINFIGMGLNVGKYAEVRPHFERLRREIPEHPEIAYLEACYALVNGNNSEALRKIQECVRIAPYSSKKRLFHAQMLHRAGKPKEALTEVRLAIELEPHNFATRVLYVHCLADDDRLEDAQAELEKALKDFPAKERELRQLSADLIKRAQARNKD